MSRIARWLPAALLPFAGCAAAPQWQQDLPQALSAARAGGRDLVVYFALPGRDASDRMQAQLDDPAVIAALAAGGFDAVVADGLEQKRLYQEWVGFGEGMGVAVLDPEARCWATRPGPQDPPEFAAFLDRCAASRAGLATLQQMLADGVVAPVDQWQLGCLLLELGCRVRAEPLLLDAATAGVADARHRLARLYALDGDLEAARRWLDASPKTPSAQVTEGYVLFKERKHAEAAQAFAAALATGELGDERQRALLYLGKALHENKKDEQAVPILERLAAEGTGSTFEAAARHTLGHIYQPEHGHTH